MAATALDVPATGASPPSDHELLAEMAAIQLTRETLDAWKAAIAETHVPDDAGPEELQGLAELRALVADGEKEVLARTRRLLAAGLRAQPEAALNFVARQGKPFLSQVFTAVEEPAAFAEAAQVFSVEVDGNT